MKLIIEDDAGRKTVVPFAEEQISIGREPGNTVRLSERNVSRRHALLAREDDAIVIEDLGSHNGVRVNGELIQGRSKVKSGDVIQIGDYDLALEDESKAAAERPTQPNLTAVPDHVGGPPPNRDVPFHRESEAVARFQKAAAIQTLLAKGERAGASPPRPEVPALTSGAQDQWPPEFHFVAPGAVEQMAKQARRRRYVFGAVIGSAVIFAAVLAFGFLRPEKVAPASPPEKVAPAPSVEPAPVLAPPVAPAPSVAPASLPEKVAPAPVPAVPPSPKPTTLSPSQTSRRKALDLYQDAFADVANGDYSDALVKLQASLELDPTSPAAHKEIAICYSHLKQPDKGAAHYEQYLKLRPDAPDAADVRRMLSDYHASPGAK